MASTRKQGIRAAPPPQTSLEVGSPFVILYGTLSTLLKIGPPGARMLGGTHWHPADRRRRLTDRGLGNLRRRGVFPAAARRRRARRAPQPGLRSSDMLGSSTATYGRPGEIGAPGQRKFIPCLQIARGGLQESDARCRFVVSLPAVVNCNLGRLLEMVFPLQSRIPPPYFGVARIGGCLRGEKLRRTFRQCNIGNITYVTVHGRKLIGLNALAKANSAIL